MGQMSGRRSALSKINIGGPVADAFEGDEHFAGGFVVEVVKVPQIEVAASKRIGEQARIQSFLAAEADLFEFDRR